MDVLNSLFESLPTYFNLDPNKVAAFSLEHDNTIALMRYSISDGVISAKTFDSFSNDFEISLEGKTVEQVASEIGAVPHYQTTVSPSSAKISAICLVDTQNESEPMVYVHNSPTWSLFKAIALELNKAKRTGDAIIKQLAVPGSEGALLDYWADHFDTSRLYNETDAVFAQRIIDWFIRPKGNNVAIEIVLEGFYGYYIQVFDLDFYQQDTMLMDNSETPAHNKNFPIFATDLIGKEECVFGLMFPENTISQWNRAQFEELRDIVYPLRAGGCRPKLFWTDAPVFDPSDIAFDAGLHFYTKYL